MNGCEMMKCCNLEDGRCTYPGETCKYRGHSSEERANADSLDCLVGQLGAATETCRQAMAKLADMYCRPDLPDDVKRSLKYICELQLGEVLRTVDFWHRELPNDLNEGSNEG